MPSNAANLGVGVGQIISAPDLGGEVAVACAIHCCDKAPYDLPPKDNNKLCQRLAHRKHSCVCHALRKHDKNGKMTQESNAPNVTASPRCSAPGISRTLIPDTIVHNPATGTNTAIDAKFPCNPASVKPGLGMVNPSVSGAGTMATGKELLEYPKIDKPVKVDSVKTMTPETAADSKGADCKC